jgi:hypothetical protein
MANHRVEWQFNIKRAPWWGGFFERLIGLTKLAIYKTLYRACVTLDELTTLVTQIEGILNDRPLTYVGDTDTASSLTPAHLLHGRKLTGLPYELTSIDELTDFTFNQTSILTERTKKLSFLIEQFWKSWSKEYVTFLRERHIEKKASHSDNVVNVGDIVLVHSDEKRIKWNLGRIERLIYGNDGIARAAQIKTKFGVTNRPIARLYPLETSNNDIDKEENDPREHVQDGPISVVKTNNNDVTRPERKSKTEAKEKISQCIRSMD